MKIIKKPWFIPIVLTIVILAVGGYYTKHLVSNAETLPENEVRKQLEETYGGKVERLSLDGTMFEVELSRNKDAYLATVDAETGKVLSMIQTKEVIEKEMPIASAKQGDSTEDKDSVTEANNTETVAQDKAPTEPEQPAPSKPKVTTAEPKTAVTPETKPKTSTNQTTPPKTSTTVLISENQAINIALGQLKGEVEDVEFVQTSDGGYYLVEIDDNDQDDEATFQIHAISGKILSVTRDD
ncbi:PepSY domain-containing protein [Sporosarcina beigongshangi]|uniref:PepSY domain-containing protein n=1 Tax=Sporosarcina beigongshangi TaxID=2782538 RepID=UPI001939F7D0|nr:PepSY domain-containing protein [Sporosarcina beigongshangi]